MSQIKSTFDSLNGVSDVKNFDQSQDKELGILEVPVAYQEFDEIEHEINNDQHSLSEISTFADKLNSAHVVRRDDVLALESIIGQLEDLPNINSYTVDYSMVNYQITQESVYSTVTKFVAKVARQIWEFIMKTFEYIKEFIASIFKRESYSNDKSKQQEVIKQLQIVTTAAKDSQGTVSAKTKTMNSEQVATRNVRVNKELRRLLYPKFNELTVLSRGGDINASLLIDEMCEQRIGPFYSTFLSAIYERDDDLKNIITLYVRNINTNLDELTNSTAEVFNSDLTVIPANMYRRMFTISPEQVNDFVKTYSVTGHKADIIRDPDDQFKVMASAAFDTCKMITSIAQTHDLPTPRVILELDLTWLGNLFDDITSNLGNEMKMSYDIVKRSYRTIQKDFDNIDPEAKANVNAVYADWIVMNKMVLTLAMFRSRVDSIWSNVNTLTQLCKEVNRIINS